MPRLVSSLPLPGYPFALPVAAPCPVPVVAPLPCWLHLHPSSPVGPFCTRLPARPCPAACTPVTFCCFCARSLLQRFARARRRRAFTRRGDLPTPAIPSLCPVPGPHLWPRPAPAHIATPRVAAANARLPRPAHGAPRWRARLAPAPWPAAHARRPARCCPAHVPVARALLLPRCPRGGRRAVGCPRARVPRLAHTRCARAVPPVAFARPAVSTFARWTRTARAARAFGRALRAVVVVRWLPLPVACLCVTLPVVARSQVQLPQFVRYPTYPLRCATHTFTPVTQFDCYRPVDYPVLLVVELIASSSYLRSLRCGYVQLQLRYVTFCVPRLLITLQNCRLCIVAWLPRVARVTPVAPLTQVYPLLTCSSVITLPRLTYPLPQFPVRITQRYVALPSSLPRPRCAHFTRCCCVPRSVAPVEFTRDCLYLPRRFACLALPLLFGFVCPALPRAIAPLRACPVTVAARCGCPWLLYLARLALRCGLQLQFTLQVAVHLCGCYVYTRSTLLFTVGYVYHVRLRLLLSSVRLFSSVGWLRLPLHARTHTVRLVAFALLVAFG